MRLRRESFLREGDELRSGFFGVVDEMSSEGFGKGRLSTTSDFGCAEAVFHEEERGVGEGAEVGFREVEKAGEKLINEGVNAIRGGGLLTDKASSGAVEFAEFCIGRVSDVALVCVLGTTGEEGFGDADEVEGVGAGEKVFTVFFSFVSIDTKNKIALLTKSRGEVGDVTGFVFTTEEDLIFRNLSSVCSSRNLKLVR